MKPPMRVGPRPLPLYMTLLQSRGFIDSWKTMMEQFPQIPNTMQMPGMPQMPFMEQWQGFLHQWQEQINWPISEMDDEPLNAVEADQFMVGVKKYHAFEWYRSADEYTLLAQEGRVKLWCAAGVENGSVIMLIPSVINKHYVFDLMKGKSLVSYLADKGYKVLVVDWGNPEEGDPLDINTAMVKRLLPLVNKAYAENGSAAFPVVGYCLGSLFALAMACLAKDKISALACVASPWDFSQTPTHNLVKKGEQNYRLMLQVMPNIPVDLLQSQFALLSPYGAIRRMSGLASIEDEEQLKRMVAIEDWLSDGIALDKSMAETILIDWHLNNDPMNKKWKIDGTLIHPESLEIPVFIAVPERDIIVPKTSAVSLAADVQSSTVVKVPAGHIGLMVGRKSEKSFYKPLVGWLSMYAED